MGCLSPTVSPPEFLKIIRKPETTAFYPALSLVAAVPSLKLRLNQLHSREIGTQISETIQYFGFKNLTATEKPENNTIRPTTGHKGKQDVVELLHLLSLLSLICFKLQALHALQFYQQSRKCFIPVKLAL
jgi:hypothetical protein